jgi:hypothetical protein
VLTYLNASPNVFSGPQKYTLIDTNYACIMYDSCRFALTGFRFLCARITVEGRCALQNGYGNYFKLETFRRVPPSLPSAPLAAPELSHTCCMYILKIKKKKKKNYNANKKISFPVGYLLGFLSLSLSLCFCRRFLFFIFFLCT